jgi:hypothetical protein
MGLIKRKKRDNVELAETTTSTNLFKADFEKLEQMRKRANQKPAPFFRGFVHQALIQQELVERQSPAAVAVDSVAIDALLKEHLAPILQELQDVKGCMQELASMRVEPPSTASGPDAAFALEHVKETNRCLSEIFYQVEDRHSDFVRIAQLLNDRQERSERWSEAAYVLSGHSFNAIFALLDLFGRYVLVPQLAAMNPQADAVKIAKTETEASSAAAAAKRKGLERRLKLPKNGKVKFLSTQLPEPRHDAA